MIVGYPCRMEKDAKPKRQEIFLREAVIEDAPAIAQVHFESWQTTYAGLLPDEYLAKMTYEGRQRRWRDILQDSENFTFVAEEIPTGIVGFINGGRERSGRGVYTGEIYSLYLLASHQKQGIGTQLVSFLVDRLRQHRMRTLLVWVLAENSARQFYEKLGGQQIDSQSIQRDGVMLEEVAYGWLTIEGLVSPQS